VKRLFAPVIVVAGLTLAACGGSDGGTSGAQSEAAQQTIDAAKDAGFDLNEGCVNDIAGQLSDDDAQAIVDAGPDGDPDVSTEGSALANQLASCLSQEDLLDEFIIGMKADGQAFDEACVRENLKNFDLRALAAQGNNAAPTDELLAALFECFDN
jgi:hypothetical protein